MTHHITLGTRPSKMALQMAGYAKQLLEAQYAGVEVEVKAFASTGDRNQGDLSKVGGKGAFVKDLEERLLNKEIDCAIHTLKDVPGDVDPHPDLELTAFLTRDDPRDALIMREGQPVPTSGEGLTLATSSPRRQAFLRRLYPQAKIIPLRGNVDTRFRKLDSGEFDGMVLAKAGLERLDFQNRITKVYAPEEMLPAVGQGVLTLQVRKVDIPKCGFLRAIHSHDTGRVVAAERRLLRVLQGNCHAAIAGYCEESAGERRLRGWVSNPLGSEVMTAEATQALTDDADALGLIVGQNLLNQGARRLIEVCPGDAA